MRNLKIPVPHISVILVAGGAIILGWNTINIYINMIRPISALNGEKDKLLVLFVIHIIADLIFCITLIVCLFLGHGFIILGERIQKQFTLLHQRAITISPMYGLYRKELIVDLRPKIPDEFKVLPAKLKSFKLYNDLHNGPTLKYRIGLWGKSGAIDKCLVTEKYDLVVGDVMKGWGAHGPQRVEKQMHEIILPVEEEHKFYYVVIDMTIDCSGSFIDLNPAEYVIQHDLKVVACVTMQRLKDVTEVSIKNAMVNPGAEVNLA